MNEELLNTLIDGLLQLREDFNSLPDNTQQLSIINEQIKQLQANISIGDTGRPATAQIMSAQMFYSTVGANFVRS